MDRVRWSEKAIPFRSLVENSSIIKPVLVQMGSTAMVVGEKINGEFLMASPCKVSGDRFDVIEQEIILASKHSGVWRVISKATSEKEGHVHRLSTRELEKIFQQDQKNERSTPRSYICIRDIEAFECFSRGSDASISGGNRIERRSKHIEQNTEFEITNIDEVEYTPTSGERTTRDYVNVPKTPGALMQLLLPGVMEQTTLVRNRVVRALHCATKNEARLRHFLLEVNDQPCEIRPIASSGSTELRYLHSTKNLYDYMSTYGNDTVLYVKLLRGDPPIKAIEFDGYLVLRNTLSGDRIPICRVEDLEITLVGPDLPTRVKLPTRSEHLWRSLSEVRAAEVQCVQLALALLARHESEMYVSTYKIAQNRASRNSLMYNEIHSHSSHQSSDTVRKHLKECEKIFGTRNSTSVSEYRSDNEKNRNNNLRQSSSLRHQTSSVSPSNEKVLVNSRRSHRHSTSTYPQETIPERTTVDSYNRIRRTTIEKNPFTTSYIPTSTTSKAQTNTH